VASDGQRLKSKSSAWLIAYLCRRVKASRSRELRQTQNAQRSHQRREPLRMTHPAAVTTVGDALEEADQVSSCGLVYGGGIGFGISREKSR